MANSHFDLTPRQRWQAEQDERTRGDPWLDFSKTLARDSQGRLIQIDRAPTADQPLDEASYQKLTYDERKLYCARMSQRK
jgi:hypothetical protein